MVLVCERRSARMLLRMESDDKYIRWEIFGEPLSQRCRSVQGQLFLMGASYPPYHKFQESQTF